MQQTSLVPLNVSDYWKFLFLLSSWQFLGSAEVLFIPKSSHGTLARVTRSSLSAAHLSRDVSWQEIK